MILYRFHISGLSYFCAFSKEFSLDFHAIRTNMVLISLENFLSFSLKVFRFITFDFRKIARSRNLKENFEISIKNFIFLFCLINVYIFVVLSVYSKIKKSSDLIFIAPFLTTTQTVIKSLALFCNKSKVCGILVQLRKLFPKDFDQQKKFKTEIYFKNFKRFFKTYVWMILVPCLTVLLIPVGKLVMSGEKTLPLDLKVPLDNFT